MSALFGILQLDRGEPWGYAQIPGLIQAWLQDAGGFAAVGLAIYLLYALSIPTDKSQSERIRVPVSRWMLLMGALSLVGYAVTLVTFFLPPVVKIAGQEIVVFTPPPPPPPPGETAKPIPPAVHTELQPLLLSIAGLLAILGLGEPFARDTLRIIRRNFSFNFTGIARFLNTLRGYAADLLTPRRVVALLIALGVYVALGAVLFAVGDERLTDIWTGILLVSLGVFVCALLLLMLFEAEGPVWAIAKLSFKEAIRSQILWIFLIIFLPFLFPIQLFAGADSKASDELRSMTTVVTVILSFLVLVPAIIIASFGIPNDIKNLNIFTVVSKPIERFEMVLGRFVGYVALMTLLLLALTGVSLVLITTSNISEAAKNETYTARVPYRGKLEFKSIVAKDREEKKEFEGTNVGREFDYRRYIAGAENSPQRAIWHFATLPAELATVRDPKSDRVRVEFTFDIFKMTKGEQNRGAFVKFQFVTHNAPLLQPDKQAFQLRNGEWDWANPQLKAQYEARAKELRQQGMGPLQKDDNARPGTANWEGANKITEEFGYYEIAGKEVFDYKPMSVEIPAGLIRNALATPADKLPKDANGNPLPRLSIYVKCESPGQLIGVAEPDLYLLLNERPYWYNFLKSMIGLWCRLCMVVGVAVALSTYLSGILALLGTACIYIIGFFTDHLSDLANNRNIGGPFQSLSQLVKAEQPTAPISDTVGTKALLFGDKGAAWVIRRVQNMIPDVESFSWGHFVAEGYNVNAEYLVVNVIVTFGYLLPWAVLGYYLMKSREVAA